VVDAWFYRFWFCTRGAGHRRVNLFCGRDMVIDDILKDDYVIKNSWVAVKDLELKDMTEEQLVKIVTFDITKFADEDDVLNINGTPIVSIQTYDPERARDILIERHKDWSTYKKNWYKT